MIQSPRIISTTYIVCLRIELNGDLEVYAREVWPGRYLFSRVTGSIDYSATIVSCYYL